MKLIFKILSIALRECLIILTCAFISFMVFHMIVIGGSMGCVYSLGNPYETFLAISKASLWVVPLLYLFGRRWVLELLANILESAWDLITWNFTK